MQKPVLTSQTLMVLSRDDEIMKSPLGTKATDDTLWSCPEPTFNIITMLVA